MRQNDWKKNYIYLDKDRRLIATEPSQGDDNYAIKILCDANYNPPIVSIETAGNMAVPMYFEDIEEIIARDFPSIDQKTNLVSAEALMTKEELRSAEKRGFEHFVVAERAIYVNTAGIVVGDHNNPPHEADYILKIALNVETNTLSCSDNTWSNKAQLSTDKIPRLTFHQLYFLATQDYKNADGEIAFRALTTPEAFTKIEKYAFRRVSLMVGTKNERLTTGIHKVTFEDGEIWDLENLAIWQNLTELNITNSSMKTSDYKILGDVINKRMQSIASQDRNLAPEQRRLIKSKVFNEVDRGQPTAIIIDAYFNRAAWDLDVHSKGQKTSELNVPAINLHGKLNDIIEENKLVKLPLNKLSTTQIEGAVEAAAMPEIGEGEQKGKTGGSGNQSNGFLSELRKSPTGRTTTILIKKGDVFKVTGKPPKFTFFYEDEAPEYEFDISLTITETAPQINSTVVNTGEFTVAFSGMKRLITKPKKWNPVSFTNPQQIWDESELLDGLVNELYPYMFKSPAITPAEKRKVEKDYKPRVGNFDHLPVEELRRAEEYQRAKKGALSKTFLSLDKAERDLEAEAVEAKKAEDLRLAKEREQNVIVITPPAADPEQTKETALSPEIMQVGKKYMIEIVPDAKGKESIFRWRYAPLEGMKANIIQIAIIKQPLNKTTGEDDLYHVTYGKGFRETPSAVAGFDNLSGHIKAHFISNLGLNPTGRLHAIIIADLVKKMQIALSDFITQIDDDIPDMPGEAADKKAHNDDKLPDLEDLTKKELAKSKKSVNIPGQSNNRTQGSETDMDSQKAKGGRSNRSFLPAAGGRNKADALEGKVAELRGEAPLAEPAPATPPVNDPAAPDDNVEPRTALEIKSPRRSLTIIIGSVGVLALAALAAMGIIFLKTNQAAKANEDTASQKTAEVADSTPSQDPSVSKQNIKENSSGLLITTSVPAKKEDYKFRDDDSVIPPSTSNIPVKNVNTLPVQEQNPSPKPVVPAPALVADGSPTPAIEVQQAPTSHKVDPKESSTPTPAALVTISTVAPTSEVVAAASPTPATEMKASAPQVPVETEESSTPAPEPLAKVAAIPNTVSAPSEAIKSEKNNLSAVNKTDQIKTAKGELQATKANPSTTAQKHKKVDYSTLLNKFNSTQEAQPQSR